MSFDAATLSGLGALAYVLALLVPALDALVPLVPGETVLLAAAVVAGDGGLVLPVVLAAGAAGAFLGDLAAYEVGRRWGGPLLRRVVDRERGRALSIARASRGFDTHGGAVLLAARFVPGGRTATTLTAGGLEFPRKRFVTCSLFAAAMWSAYICVLGLVGSALFGGNLVLGLAAGLALAAAVGGAAELARRRWSRSRPVLEATESEQYVTV